MLGRALHSGQSPTCKCLRWAPGLGVRTAAARIFWVALLDQLLFMLLVLLLVLLSLLLVFKWLLWAALPFHKSLVLCE